MNEAQLTAFSGELLTALWRAAWQGTLAIGVLYGLCRSLEARYPPSANLRCWLWRAGYLKLLLALTSVTGVALAVLPTPLMPPSTPIRAFVAGAMSAPGANPLPTATVPIAQPLRATVRAGQGAAIGALRSWQVWVAGLYLLGVAICLIRVAQAGLRTRRVLRRATVIRVDDALNVQAYRLAPLMGLRRTPTLVLSPHIAVPCCAADTILLPMSASGAPSLTDYTPEARRLILAHELAHIRRGDLVWEWLGTLTQVVFFFHPLIYLARREERLSRESAADSDALRVTQSLASAYAALLIGISHTAARRPQDGFFGRPASSESGESVLAGVVGVLERGVLLRRRLLYLKENNMISASARRRFLSVALPVLLAAAAVLTPWRVTTIAAAQTPQDANAAPVISSETDAEKRIDVLALARYKKFFHPSENSLTLKAYTALAAGQTAEATDYAQQLLNKNRKSREYGEFIYTANQIKGLAALDEGHIDYARCFLLAAGQTPGSPRLDSFGPDMMLAQRLLDRGEKEVVVQYLDLVARFWMHTSEKELAREKKEIADRDRRLYAIQHHWIEEKKRQIAAGEKPKLNNSDEYW